MRVSTIPREERFLRRSRSERLLGGVCGGLADYFGVDPLIFRLAFIAVTLAQGAGILIYVVLWILVPEEGVEKAPAGRELVKSGIESARQDVDQAAQRLRSGAPHRQGLWLGGVLIVAGAYLLAVNAGILSWWNWTIGGPLLLIALGLVLLLRRAR
jgi:phage shock protein C